MVPFDINKRLSIVYEHKQGIFKSKDVYRRMSFGHMVILQCDFAEAL